MAAVVVALVFVVGVVAVAECQNCRFHCRALFRGSQSHRNRRNRRQRQRLFAVAVAVAAASSFPAWETERKCYRSREACREAAGVPLGTPHCWTTAMRVPETLHADGCWHALNVDSVRTAPAFFGPAPRRSFAEVAGVALAAVDAAAAPRQPVRTASAL